MKVRPQAVCGWVKREKRKRSVSNIFSRLCCVFSSVVLLIASRLCVSGPALTGKTSFNRHTADIFQFITWPKNYFSYANEMLSFNNGCILIVPIQYGAGVLNTDPHGKYCAAQNYTQHTVQGMCYPALIVWFLISHKLNIFRNVSDQMSRASLFAVSQVQLPRPAEPLWLWRYERDNVHQRRRSYWIKHNSC